MPCVSELIGTLVQTEPVSPHLDDPHQEVARLIAKYNLLLLPIVETLADSRESSPWTTRWT